MDRILSFLERHRLGRAALARPRLVGGVLLGALLIFAGAIGPKLDIDVYLLAGREFFREGGLYEEGFGTPLHTPLPYTYPPVWAAIVGTVAWLPWRGVAWAWTVLNVTLLVWLVRRSYEVFLATSQRAAPLVVAALAGLLAFTEPVMGTFSLGQVGLLLTAAIVADAVPRRTRLPRGVLVGFATAVKLTPGIFVAYWLVTKRWRAALTACVTALGLWAAAAALRPDLSSEYWFHVAFEVDRTTEDLGIVINQSLAGLLERIGWAGIVAWAILAALTLVVALYRARAAHAAGDELAAVTLIGIAGLLISPVSWIHHAVWIVPVTGLLLGDGRTRQQWIAWGSVLVLFILRLPRWTSGGLIPTDTLTALFLENAYVLAYVVLLLFLPIRPTRSEPSEPIAGIRSGGFYPL
jgi:alpha-1,2-mannosyltransferase